MSLVSETNSHLRGIPHDLMTSLFVRYLAELHSSGFGRRFDISTTEGRLECADWLTDTVKAAFEA